MRSASILFDAPGPRARIRGRMGTVLTLVVTVLLIGVVYARLDSKGQLAAEKWEPFLTSDLWMTYVLPGIRGTLTAAALSIVLALALGLVLGVGRLSHTVPIRRVC